MASWCVITHACWALAIGVQLRTLVMKLGCSRYIAQPEPNLCSFPPFGSLLSCVPHPISDGWVPSEKNPSIDHVFTNSPYFFDRFDACVSRSAMWMTLMPSICASRAHFSRDAGCAIL